MPKIPISNGYFTAFFKSPNLINEFRKNSQGMTSDTWNLKYPQIETIKICIPALSEQNRVADLIGTLERRIAKQAQLVDWPLRVLHACGDRDVPAQSLSGQVNIDAASGGPHGPPLDLCAQVSCHCKQQNKVGAKVFTLDSERGH